MNEPVWIRIFQSQSFQGGLGFGWTLVVAPDPGPEGPLEVLGWSRQSPDRSLNRAESWTCVPVCSTLTELQRSLPSGDVEA